MSVPAGLRDPRDLKRCDRVVVTEPGIAPWFGTVGSVKPGTTAVYVDVERDGDLLTWSVPAQYVEPEERQATSKHPEEAAS